jgi:hypothetical protein
LADPTEEELLAFEKTLWLHDAIQPYHTGLADWPFLAEAMVVHPSLNSAEDCDEIAQQLLRQLRINRYHLCRKHGLASSTLPTIRHERDRQQAGLSAGVTSWAYLHLSPRPLTSSWVYAFMLPDRLAVLDLYWAFLNRTNKMPTELHLSQPAERRFIELFVPEQVRESSPPGYRLSDFHKLLFPDYTGAITIYGAKVTPNARETRLVNGEHSYKLVELQ